MKLLIDIDENLYTRLFDNGNIDAVDMLKACVTIRKGMPLPKGHGRLIDENYLLSFLQCEEYETCTWSDCSDCDREKSIKRRGILDAPTIIEADKESEEEE